MKTKIIAVLALLLLISGALLYFTVQSSHKYRLDANRQRHNVEVLNKNFKSYKNAYGQSVAKVEALNYTVSELKKNESELLKKLAKNKIKPAQIQSVADIGTQLQIDTTIAVIYVDSVKCFRYSDKWNSVSGCFTSHDSADIQLQSRDSLQIVPTIVPKRFLFIKYGVKGIELNVVNSNPYAFFNYARYIEVKK